MIKKSKELIVEHGHWSGVTLHVGKLLAEYSSRENRRQSLPKLGRKDSDRTKERFV